MLLSLVSNGLPVQHETHDVMVPWWSFTKTVLSAAALSLVHDGLVRLDDTVLEGPFTLRQLLRHEAGLADYGELAQYHAAVARDEVPWSADEMMHRLDALRGHTGCGPGSVLAVYRSACGAHTASCAVFHEGSNEGAAEAEVVHRLSTILKPEKKDG